jgi:hypothetical protein
MDAAAGVIRHVSKRMSQCLSIDQACWVATSPLHVRHDTGRLYKQSASATHPAAVATMLTEAPLLQMLESSYAADVSLTSAALACLWAVLLVHGPTPVNHYCRLLAKDNLMPLLVSSISSMIAAARSTSAPMAAAEPPRGGTLRAPLASGAEPVSTRGSGKDTRMRTISDHLESACDLVIVLSRSDAVVKAAVSHPATFQKLLGLVEDLPGELLSKALTAVCNLTEDPQAVHNIQEARGVPALVTLLRLGETRSRVLLTSEMQLPLLEVLRRCLLVSTGCRRAAHAFGWQLPVAAA